MPTSVIFGHHVFLELRIARQCFPDANVSVDPLLLPREWIIEGDPPPRSAIQQFMDRTAFPEPLALDPRDVLREEDKRPAALAPKARKIRRSTKTPREVKMRLEQLAEVTRGFRSTKANLLPSTGRAYRVVQVGHMQDGEVLPTKELKTVYVDASRKPGRFALRAGDILLAMLGSNPKVAAVGAVPKTVLADKDVAIIRPSNSRARQKILKYLRSDEGQKVLRSLRSGVTIPHMTTAALNAIEIG
jgi:hypothetical protein